MSLFTTIHAMTPLGLVMGSLSSLSWTVAYALILRRGARDRLPGMPLTALAANLTWEITFLVVTVRHGAFDARLAMLLPWTLLDLGIAAQWVRYGARDATHPLQDPLLRRFQPAALLAVLVLVAAVLLAILHEFDDAIGWYTAFGQNLMMSVLFVHLLLRRGHRGGQSMGIGVAKLLGTFFAFLLALFWSPPSLHEHWGSLLPAEHHPIAPLIAVLYAVTLLFDVFYLVLLRAKAGSPAEPPARNGADSAAPL